MPRVPERATRARALARSGAVHVPWRGRACGVGAVGPVARGVRRQDLARRLGDVGAAECVDGRGAIGGVVQCPAHVESVERREAGVEEERDRRRLRVRVHLARVAGRRSQQAGPAEGGVSDWAVLKASALPRITSSTASSGVPPISTTILSGYPSGCAAFDHSWKYGIAHEREEVLRAVGRDHVRPGCRQRAWMGAGFSGRRSRGHDVGEGERELVQELRVGRDEMEGDRLRGVVRDDPAREVAALRMSARSEPRRRCRRSTTTACRSRSRARTWSGNRTP